MSAQVRSGSAADYPYDEGAVVDMLDGLDKLRAVKDRRLAQQLYELWYVAESNGRDPGFHARERRRVEKKLEEELDGIKACAHSALNGAFGQRAEELARTMLCEEYSDKIDEREEALRAFMREVRRIPTEQRDRREDRKAKR